MGKDRKDEKKPGNYRRLRIFTIVLGVVVVLVLIVFYGIYYQFAYAAKDLTKKSANIYAFGKGENMKALIAPGYVEHFDGSSEVLTVADIQDIYIGRFRSYVNERVGDIDDIDCRITDIMAVSNVDDVSGQYAENGVKGLSQYRSVNADWIVTGKDGGSVTIQVQVCVLKCDDGWYVDYVLLPEEISGVSTETDSTASGTDAE